jgi:tRNA(Ile)-lysidine synthase
LVRPLLEVKRHAIETWLRDRGIEWRQDETNCDPSYARNRLRHQTLPLLREQFNPRLDEALVHLASLAQDEERYWSAELDQYQLAPPESPILSATQLAGLPPAVARRLVRRIISHIKGDLRQIDFTHVEKILEMARSPQGHARVHLPGVEVIRSLDWLRFAPPGFTSRSKHGFSIPLRAPSSVELPGSCTRITLQLLEKPESPEAYATVVNDLDWQRLTVREEAPSGLELRNWRPGDQYRQVGRSKQEKVKVLFQEARVPLWERRNWPIITYNETILWVRRFGAAAEFVAGPETRVILRVGESVSGSSNRSDGL